MRQIRIDDSRSRKRTKRGRGRRVGELRDEREFETGFAGVEFDNYGLLPESAFASIKQAIRFGRRSAK